MQLSIAERLVQARVNKDMTQAQAASKLDISWQTLNQWESGAEMPGLNDLSRISLLYEVTADWLLNGKTIDMKIIRVTENLSDRLFDENRMYTYIKGCLAAKSLYQSLRLLPYIKEKHQGQDRKGKEHIPYFSHPLQLTSHAIALGLMDDDLISTALLHDVCEDCGILVEDLPANDATKEAVRLLTKEGFPARPQDEDEEAMRHYREEKKSANMAYYAGIRTNRNAVIVKLLDRCHNVSSMSCARGPERLAEYILDTEEYIYPLMEYAKNNYTEYFNQIYLIKYHMRSVIETIRHILPMLK